MKCPECGKRMFRKNKAWECPNCGYTHVKNNNENIFTKLNARNISNKINDYRKNNDGIGKIIDGIGNVTEQVSIQAKKEQAYIKSRNNGDSTELFDDNEFFISKVVLDGVDFVSAKKQERDETHKKEEREAKNIKKQKNENSVNDEKIVEEETEVRPVNKIKDEKPKEETSAEQIEEIDYINLGLSDLQESLIKSLPVITNPSEYEENIIKKYAEFNSEERKELLKDCWTITKLAEEHNIDRNEVQKAILTDEFLEKDLIGVFKVNPNNIRSLKILYRKPLTKKQEADNLSTNVESVEDVKEIPEEPVHVSKIKDNSKSKKAQQEETNKTFYNKKSPNARSLKKEFENQLKFYLGGNFTRSEDCKKRLVRHNKMDGDTNVPSIINTLKKEFFNGKLAFEDIDRRIDELMELDVLSLKKEVVDKKQDSSIIKTQDDLNKFLGPEYVEKYKKKVDRKSRGKQLFKKYNVNIENAHCFECKLAEQRQDTIMSELKENAWGNGYVALFDDRLVILDETFLLKVNLTAEKVFFNNVEFINFEGGSIDSPSTLYIGLRTKGQIILGYILPEDANKVIENYEKYTGKSESSGNTSKADELLKYADLFKQGLLSEEEFEAKKKELL